MKRLVPRDYERKRFIGEAVVRPLVQGQPLSARVLNLGQSGLALFTERGLTKGQLVELKSVSYTHLTLPTIYSV